MENVSIAEIVVGDFVECSCQTGCYDITGCMLSCRNNPCCAEGPVWEQVLKVIPQPSGNTVTIYLELTNSKLKFGFSDTLVTKRL